MLNTSAFQVWTGKVQRFEFQYTAKGHSRATLTVRYPERKRVQAESGEYEYKTMSGYSPFLVAWGTLAESMEKILKIGMTVTVLTSYERDSYEKDGQTIYVDRFKVESWQVADWHADKDKEGSDETPSYEPEPAVFDADDIPF